MRLVANLILNLFEVLQVGFIFDDQAIANYLPLIYRLAHFS
ncbi:MAG TPA: hypothetical protein V6C63_10905 [Allocoleopsis sp.]